jgi:hypothetical protein
VGCSSCEFDDNNNAVCIGGANADCRTVAIIDVDITDGECSCQPVCSLHKMVLAKNFDVCGSGLNTWTTEYFPSGAVAHNKDFGCPTDNTCNCDGFNPQGLYTTSFESGTGGSNNFTPQAVTGGSGSSSSGGASSGSAGSPAPSTTVTTPGTVTFSSDYYSVGEPGSPGWVCDPNAMKNWNFSPSNCIQSGGTYDYTDQNQTCGCGSSGASGSAAMPTAPAAPSVPVVPPVITGGGFTPSYEPWAIYIQGTNLTGSLVARLIDGNNLWADQLPTKLSSDGTWLSLHVPSDKTPTGSNVNKYTMLTIILTDTKTNAVSNAYDQLQMPPAPLAAIVADAGSAPSAPSTSGAPVMTDGGVVTTLSPWAVWVAGRNLTSSTHARVMDGGNQWGADLPMVLSGSTGGSFSLPSSYMPSGCNQGPNDNCYVKVKMVDSATGLIGAAHTLSVPRAQ